MVEHRAWSVAAVLCAGACGIGCGGGTSDTAPTTAAGSAGMDGGGATTAGTSSGGATSGAGGNATGGTATEPCTWQFGVPELVFAEDPQFSVNGVSLTGDELELYYSQDVRGATLPEQTVVRRSRANAAADFGAAIALPELAGVCAAGQRVNPDISEDGLTLYVSCTNYTKSGENEGVSPLRVAHRADRNAAFTLEAEPAGALFASAGLSSDELTAYTDGEVFGNAPQMFTRASKAEKFGAAQAVPGLTMDFASPDISRDGLAIFGSTNLGETAGRSLARATRLSVDAAFGTPVKVELQLTGIFGAPNITPACALYFVHLTSGVPTNNVYVARQP